MSDRLKLPHIRSVETRHLENDTQIQRPRQRSTRPADRGQ